MADERKRFIIETIYDSQGLKAYAADLETARVVSKKFGIDISNSAKLLEQSTSKSFNKAGNEITRTTSIIQDHGQKVKVVYDKLGSQTRAVSTSFVNFKDNTAVLGNELKNLVTRAALVIPTWLILRSVFTGVLELIKSSIQFMIDWEFQLAQIRIVSNNSAQEIENLSRSLLTLSRNFGISNKDIGEGAKLYVQQGLAMKDIIPLMNATAKLSLLTGRSITQSVEDLTAVLKAYRLESNEAINVVDSLTNVELVHAVTTADLAQALKQVASTASTTGVSLSSLIGFITAIKAETRDTGNKVGLSLRTMFARITTSSADAIQTLTGVPFFLDETGKVTNQVTPVMRNLDSILQELSISFKGLSDAEKLQLAQMVGGTNRLNQASALFNNFNEGIQAQADSLFSLGKADRAVSILTDTMELRVKRLKGAWDEFVASVANTDGLKKATGFLADLIQGTTAIVNPDEAFRTGLLDEFTKAQEQSVRNSGFADALLEVKRQAEDLANIVERNPKAIEDANIRTAIWAEQINKVGKDFGIAIDTSVTTPQQLVDALTKQLDQIRNIKINSSLEGIKDDIRKELINDSTDIRKIIGANFTGKGLLGEGTVGGKGEGIFDGLVTAGLSEELKRARRIFIDFQKGIFINPEQAADLKNTFKNILNPSDFADFSRLVDDLLKNQQAINNVESRRSQLLGEQIKKEEELGTIAQSSRLTKEQIEESLLKIEQDGIKNSTDRLVVVNKEVDLLKAQGAQLDENLQKKLDHLETEKLELEVAKKRADLESRQNIALNALKLSGASDLQVLIQELAFLTKIGAKEDELRKKREEIAIERQNVEANAQQAIVDAQVESLKTQGLSEAEIIKGRIELEKRLGIERQGLDALKEQLELLQAINKEQQKTPQERLKDLSEAIKAKKKSDAQTSFGNSASFGIQGSFLSSKASFAGISQEQIDRILKPASDIKVDLPKSIQDLSQDNEALGINIDKLASAIESLAQTVLQDSEQSTVANRSLSTQIPTVSSLSPSSASSVPSPLTVSRGQTANVGGSLLVEINIGDTQVLLNPNADRETIARVVNEQLDNQNTQRKSQIISEIARQLRTPGTDLNKADRDNFESF